MIQNKKNIIDIDNKQDLYNLNKNDNKDLRLDKIDDNTQWKNYSNNNFDSNKNKELQNKESNQTDKHYNKIPMEKTNEKDNDTERRIKKNEYNLKEKSGKNKNFEIDENSNIELKFDESEFASEGGNEKLNILMSNLGLRIIGLKQENNGQLNDKKEYRKENQNIKQKAYFNSASYNINNRVIKNQNFSEDVNKKLSKRKDNSGEFILTCIEDENEKDKSNSHKNKNISNLLFN